MISVTESILIESTPKKVFDYATQYENDPAWRAGVFEVRYEPGTKKQPGKRTREVMRFMGQNLISYGVVDIQPSKLRSTFRNVSGPSKATGYRLAEPEGDKSRFTYHAQFAAGGVYKILSPFVKYLFRRRVCGDLKRLKIILETDTGKD